MTISTRGTYGAQVNRISIKATGTTCQVDDNPSCRLSYYLNCIENVSSLDFGRLSAYKNFRSFDDDDIRMIVKLCDLFSPDVLAEANAFVLVSDSAHDSSNEFYELNSQKFVAVKNSSFTIGSFSGKVTKIMSFKKSWLMRNYVEPLNAVKRAFIEVERRRRSNVVVIDDEDCTIF